MHAAFETGPLPRDKSNTVQLKSISPDFPISPQNLKNICRKVMMAMYPYLLNSKRSSSLPKLVSNPATIQFERQ
jgi:hypothetical protein